MADRDNNDDSPVLVPAAAGAIVGAAGATALSNVIHSDASVDKGLEKATGKLAGAQVKYDTKAAKVEKGLLKDDANVELRDNYVAAKSAKEVIEIQHAEATKAAWKSALDGLDAPAQANLEIASLKSELGHLEAAPAGTARAFHSEATKAQIAAIEKLTEDPVFKMLAKDEPGRAIARNMIRDTVEKANEDFAANLKTPLTRAQLAEVHAFSREHGPALDALREKTIAEAHPDLVAQVASDTRITGEGLAQKTAALETAELGWPAKLEKAIGREGRTLKSAEENLERLNALKEINVAEKGFLGALKRPISHLKSAGAGTKLAIVGTGITLGALTYNGLRERAADKAAERQNASFAERLDQQKFADQSAGRGAS